MGCPASFQFYAQSSSKAEEVKAQIIRRMIEYDQYYTNYSAKSFTAEINRSAGSSKGIIVDNETAVLLDYAQSCYELSNGLFDITSGPLHRIWMFDAKEPMIPTDREINKVLKTVGWDKVIWEKPRLILPVPEMNLDFGGVVKEYAVDVGVNLARQLGINHGVLELGGDVGVIGPHLDGKSWKIGIESPQDRSIEVAAIHLKGGAVATSGNYARSMIVNGTRYCHILNPKTGYPVQGVASVTVQADLCLVAGSLTTIAFLKGIKGLGWLKEQGVPFVFIDDAQKLTNSIN
jgi:FAD:protein FMN transferase